MFVNDYSIALALALIPCLIAGFAFSPVFGIKFKSQQVGLVLFYSILSTLMAVATMMIAYIVLVSLTIGRVSSPTGADTSTVIITAITGLVVLIVLTRGNVSLLTILAFRFPNNFELPSQKRSITLAAATVALLQIALSWAAPTLSSIENQQDSTSQQADPLTPERIKEIDRQRESDRRLFKSN